MKNFLPRYIFCLIASGLFLSGCQSTKPAFLFQPQPGISFTATSTASDTLGPKPVPEQLSEKIAGTVSFSGKKVKVLATLVIPESNAKAVATKNIFPKKTQIRPYLKSIKDIKDEPVKGPARTFSGIFLALGMALLLAALVMAIIGTSGAGTLAIIGGSSFVAGAILAIVCLLSY